MTDPCVVCIRNTESKAKPGIFPCAGCKQMFCTQHVAFHRQELTNELDLIIGERNELQYFFDHRQDLPDTSVHMNTIDEWLKKTIEQIHQIADNARQRLINIGKEQRTNIKDEILLFSKQLNDMRETENFFEQDLENMKSKCNHLKTILNQVNTSINTTDIYSSLDKVITFEQVEAEAEAEPINIKDLTYVENIVKHQNVYQQIKLPHGGKLYLGDRFALIKNGINGYTIVNFNNNSMRSLSLGNFGTQVHCWSSSDSAFFYLNEGCIEMVKITPISDRVRKEEMDVNTEDEIMDIAYFNNTILTVTNPVARKIVIEEWKVIGKHIRIRDDIYTQMFFEVI